MPRSIWKGAIAFGLIHIPVGLYPATRDKAIDLDMLDKRDFSPIGYQRVNKASGEPVKWENVVKGYEYEKGEYVVLSPEDFRRANVEATQTIDVHGFTDSDAIAPYHFNTPYYLGPVKRGEKVYGLLRDALARANKLAIASIVIRTRQHIAALMPIGDALLLNTLRYADEVLPAKKVLPDLKRTSASAKEVQMALRLIEEMSEAWKPEQYHDTYREDLMKRIEEKIESGQTKQITADRKRAAPGAKVVDLMALLRESVERQKGGKGNGAATKERASGPRSSYTRRRVSRTRGRRSVARRA